MYDVDQSDELAVGHAWATFTRVQGQGQGSLIQPFKGHSGQGMSGERDIHMDKSRLRSTHTHTLSKCSVPTW